MEDKFSMDRGGGGWFQDDSRALHSSSPPALWPGSVLGREVGDPCLRTSVVKAHGNYNHPIQAGLGKAQALQE